MYLDSSIGSPDTIHLSFSDPAASPWRQQPPQSRWRLVGYGAISFEGTQVVMSARRYRMFLPGKAQQIRFALSSVLNVLQVERALHFEVMHDERIERVKCWADDAISAAGIAQRLPTVRSEKFAKRVADRQAFDLALQNLPARAVVTPALVALNVLIFMGQGERSHHGSIRVPLIARH